MWEPDRASLTNVPHHVAIVMDGNGRWALGRGLPRPAGHKKGAESVRQVVRSARRLGVKALTLYAFSEQNWERPASEVASLMALLREFLYSEQRELITNGIRLRAIGSYDRLPRHVLSVLEMVSKATAQHRDMTLTLALSYGGQEEIVQAAKTFAARVAKGERSLDDLDPMGLSELMPSHDVGPVDLLIRTGGERRISNFLLWGSAYAELHFSRKLWPEYTERDFFDALVDYENRERRYGRVLEPHRDADEPLEARLQA